MSTTEAQITANQANAEKSTGPTTEAGKARSSLNAIKTGLTGRILLIPEHDAPIYQKHLDRFFAKYSPATDDEHDLVQSIVDDEWRLLSIVPRETGIWALGRDVCAALVVHEKDPNRREGLLLAHISLVYKSELSNLALQERRLTNKIEKNVAKLEALQKERTDARLKEMAQAKRSLEACEKNNLEPEFDLFGFDFSVDEFKTYLTRSQAFHILSGGKTYDFNQFLAEYRAEIAQTEVEAA
jgi:hypothetical protein